MTTVDDLRVGQIVDGRYELMSRLGRGGMGCVYRAEHRGIRKDVALKLLAPIGGASTSVDRARFEREAFATGRLKHPNCVAITDFGKLDDGALYLVMELLEGRPLSSVLEADGPMPPVRALHIVRHILEGLAHAHDLGIVHRDLKPPNVIVVEHLGDPDFAKVLDFGLAKLQGETSEAEGGGKLTAAGLTFGTPRYMSPEQIFGQPVDYRTDLYAVSVMLFELLSGVVPFDGPDVRGILLAHGARVVPRIHEVGSGITVPVEIELLIRQGMAKDPRDRVQTAREYIQRIDECLVVLGHSPPVRPITRPPREPSQPTANAAPEVPTARGFVHGMSATVPLTPSAPAPGAVQTLGPRPVVRGRLSRRAVAGIASAVAAAVVAGGVALYASGPAATGDEGAAATASQRAVAGEERAADAPDAPVPGEDGDDQDGSDDADLAMDIARAVAAPNRPAVQQLSALRQTHPDSAEVMFALGRLYFARPWPSEALKSYRKAIALDPSYRSNATIIAHAIALLSSRSSRWAAQRLLEQDIGEPALPALDAAARGHANKGVRDRAARIARAIR